MDITEITINKWESFQPRKDRANHTWFRVENSIAFSESLHGLTADQKWFWICLLAYASKKGSGKIPVNWSYFATTFGVTAKKMKEALKSIEAHGAVTLSYGVSRCQEASLQTDRQTDRQTDMAFDFEVIYSGYPRKEGKAEGMTRLKRRIKTEAEYVSFAKAVRKYASLCKLQGKDQKYILKWSSFVGTEGAERWLDHVETLSPSTSPPPPPTSQASGAFSFESKASEPELSTEEIEEMKRKRAEIIAQAKRMGA